MSRSSSGPNEPSPEVQARRKFLDAWVNWQISTGNQPAIRIVTFHKGGVRLVVYVYRNCCGCVTFAAGKQSRKFRGWKQPFHKVEPKLLESGWVKVEDKENARHVH